MINTIHLLITWTLHHSKQRAFFFHNLSDGYRSVTLGSIASGIAILEVEYALASRDPSLFPHNLRLYSNAGVLHNIFDFASIQSWQ